MPRSRLYSKPTEQAERDNQAIAELKAVHEANPYYGVTGFAIALNWNEKKARRIRNMAGVSAARRSKRQRYGKRVPAEVAAPTDALKPYIDFKNDSRPQDGQTYAAWSNPERGYKTSLIYGFRVCGYTSPQYSTSELGVLSVGVLVCTMTPI